MTSIVLAGGKGVRLRADKALKRIGGQTLLQRVIERLALLGNEVLVVTAQDQPDPPLPPGARIAVDLYPGKGPLCGIYTGLMASNSFRNLVVACDMPFLNPSLLRYLIQLSPDFDAVIPRVEGMMEPLHAIYSKACLEPIKQQIEQQGGIQIRGFLEQVKVRYVESGEIDEFDPEHLSFFNINTPADLKKARALLETHL